MTMRPTWRQKMKWNKSKDILALMVGHGVSSDGTWDPGCAYDGYTEAGLMLPIVKAAAKLLRKSGVKVITDADDANNRNMLSSVAWANSKKAKLYMSVHCNNTKDATTKKPTGIMPLYVSEDGKKFAEAVGKKVMKLMDMKSAGVCRRTDLYELNGTNMPSCIFETGFIKADLAKLKQGKKYGRALAKAILAYIGVPVYMSSKAKIAREAMLLAYAGHPDKAKYPSGRPKPEYKAALNEAYPDRSKWGTAPKAGASCDVFAGTVIRSSGVDKKFPRALSAQVRYLKNSKKFKQVKKPTVKTLKSGDIIIYGNKNGKGHICIFVNGRIKHASYKKWYGRTTNNAKAMLSAKGRKFVRVYRAK